MSDPFIGQIMMFGGNFAPRGWALCDGQLLQIANNTALFSLLGTTYGGDGRTTFGLPDLRGRAPLHAGSGPGLTPRNLGQRGGGETNTLTVQQMPSHTHAPNAVAGAANQQSPANNFPASEAAGVTATYSNQASPDTTMNALAVGNAGGGQAVNNMQPYVTVNFIIALVGVFPSRN